MSHDRQHQGALRSVHAIQRGTLGQFNQTARREHMRTMNQLAPKGAWRTTLRKTLLVVVVWVCVAVPAGRGVCDPKNDWLNTAICHAFMAPILTIGLVMATLHKGALALTPGTP